MQDEIFEKKKNYMCERFSSFTISSPQEAKKLKYHTSKKKEQEQGHKTKTHNIESKRGIREKKRETETEALRVTPNTYLKGQNVFEMVCIPVIWVEGVKSTNLSGISLEEFPSICGFFITGCVDRLKNKQGQKEKGTKKERKRKEKAKQRKSEG